MERDLKPHLAVLAANVFFGINFSAVQHITRGFIQPFGLNMIRVGICVILFWLLLLFYPSKAGIRKEHFPRFFLCSLTGVVINQLLFIKGLSMTLSIHAALLILVTPIFITFVAAWLDKESLTIWKILGLSLGIGGAALLVAGKESKGGGNNILVGNILIIINAISYAFYFALVKPLMKAYRPTHVIRWVFTLGLPFMVFFGWEEFKAVQWSGFQEKEWAALALIVLGATFFAYLFNIYGISKLGAGITGSYIYTQPIFATIIAVFFLGEHLTWPKVLAALLIVSGVWLVGKKTGNQRV
ncbi:DMT family transporter [Flavihumibacter rivuli]|uniref:DMT family transporter n=1 Tax=Flavihumibacter rivuli TaxID=2838156 RepID=UPI001BDF40B0|nr:DMT family transporter [Flavihumibacter rivuli]ULQ55763.1 DMT family transporter [Flavihumibacter rivuli]